MNQPGLHRDQPKLDNGTLSHTYLHKTMSTTTIVTRREDDPEVLG